MGRLPVSPERNAFLQFIRRLREESEMWRDESIYWGGKGHGGGKGGPGGHGGAGGAGGHGGAGLTT